MSRLVPGAVPYIPLPRYSVFTPDENLALVEKVARVEGQQVASLLKDCEHRRPAQNNEFVGEQCTEWCFALLCAERRLFMLALHGLDRPVSHVDIAMIEMGIRTKGKWVVDRTVEHFSHYAGALDLDELDEWAARFTAAAEGVVEQWLHEVREWALQPADNRSGGDGGTDPAPVLQGSTGEVADYLHCSPQSVRNWEKGRRTIKTPDGKTVIIQKARRGLYSVFSEPQNPKKAKSSPQSPQIANGARAPD